MTEHIDPLHEVIRRAACAHAWLLERLLRRGGHDAEADDRLAAAKDHAEIVAVAAAHDAGEPDPFLPMPAGPDPDPIGWFDAGFSALVLRLVMLHVRPPEADKASQGNTLYGAMTDGTDVFIRYAFRRAADQAGLETRIDAFEIPAVEAWGLEFLKTAIDALGHRLPRRALLDDAVASLTGSGLPEDPWRYLEPQLARHGKAFGIGRLKMIAIKARLWLAT